MNTITNNFTTIRIDRQTKEILDSITPKNKSYSEMITKLASILDEKEVTNLFMKSLNSSTKYVDLDEL